MPRRIFRDPLQARLKAMEKKNPSTRYAKPRLTDSDYEYDLKSENHKLPPLRDSLKLNPKTRTEVVEQVKQDPAKHIAPGKLFAGKELKDYGARERARFDIVREANSGKEYIFKKNMVVEFAKLEEYAKRGSRKYRGFLSELNYNWHERNGVWLEDLPPNHVVRLFVERMNKIYRRNTDPRNFD